MYMRDIFMKRNDRGHFKLLIPDLLSDESMFFNYFRMSKQRFNDLLRREVENIGFGALGQISSNNHSKSAAQIRDDFKNYFLTAAGSVPWQNKVADCGRLQNNN